MSCSLPSGKARRGSPLLPHAQIEYDTGAMRKVKRGLLDELARLAPSDQAIITITAGKGKLLLPVEGQIQVAGDYVYLSLPAAEGLFVKGSDGNLGRVAAQGHRDAEGAFFPERAAELAQLAELAKKYGYSLATEDDDGRDPPRRTRAPKGQGKASGPKRERPKKGQKFTSQQNGLKYEVTNDDGTTLTMKCEDGSKKEVKYSGIFWRWYTADAS